jgi:hypothetical protein
MQTPENYASRYHIDTVTAEKCLAEIGPYIHNTCRQPFLLSLNYLLAYSISDIPVDVKQIEKNSLKLLTNKGAKLSMGRRIALLKALFLSISPEVQSIVEHPWLLTYLLQDSPKLSNDDIPKLQAHLDMPCQTKSEELLDEVLNRDWLIAQAADLHRQGITVTTPAAFPCTFKDASEVWEARNNPQSISASPELQFCDSIPYNRLHKHTLIEIDPKRPKKEIMANIEKIIDEIQTDIIEERLLDQEPVEEWEISEKKLQAAIEAYFVVKIFGWPEEEERAREVVRKIHGNEQWSKIKKTHWDLLKVELEAVKMPICPNRSDERKWKKRRHKYATAILDAAINQEPIKEVPLT